VFIQQVQKCLLLKPIPGSSRDMESSSVQNETSSTLQPREVKPHALDATAIACKSCCLTLILPESGLYMFGTSQLENQVLQC